MTRKDFTDALLGGLLATAIGALAGYGLGRLVTFIYMVTR